MAAPTTSAKELKIHEGGDWTTKTVVCNTIGELRVELNIPDGVQVNISDTLYTDNTGGLLHVHLSDRGLIVLPLTKSQYH